MKSTDKSLLDAHSQGDLAAFGELVRRYGGSVMGYLTRMSGSQQDAEDLFQETFKRVHEKAHTLRSDQFKPWLFKIATRVAIDGLRKSRRLAAVSLNQNHDCGEEGGCELGAIAAAADSCNPSEEVIKAERKKQVRHAVGSLPAKQRAALALAYFEHLSYREVAEVMGCSIGTVKTHMYRALRKLAQILPDVSGEA